MAEWLRRQTRNLLSVGGIGSNPVGVDFSFFFQKHFQFFLLDEVFFNPLASESNKPKEKVRLNTTELRLKKENFPACLLKKKLRILCIAERALLFRQTLSPSTFYLNQMKRGILPRIKLLKYAKYFKHHFFYIS